MIPARVYLTADGEFYIHAWARVLDDRERNDAWLATGGRLDATDTRVEWTRFAEGGTLVVDTVFFARFTRIESEDVGVLDALPVQLRDPSEDGRDYREAYPIY